ncbi:lysine--tRNA ligase [Immundisolibacter sp.]|uniref:lysine--tRNA ligase n=1 Tax=Immundisolibacter sp. TaxID=1934948 RepID=UPI003562BB84
MHHEEDNEQIANRREKLATWRHAGQAYPNDFRRDALAADLLAAHADTSAETLEAQPVLVRLAGRIMTRRLMGKASFVHLQDSSGRLQAYVQRDVIGQEPYAAFKQLDLGDIVGVTGTLFRTKTGELTVRAESVRLLTKALRPLPDKWHGLQDSERRHRQRYLDLIVNDEARRTFAIRSALVTGLREWFVGEGFLEVETPLMQSMPGGAVARPFVTHHNALDMTLYLRIAPELYLKRLVVGGFEKVFELGRNFRNEGLSTRHNPEFTMLEFYQAYADYRDLMDLTERLMRDLATRVLGTTALTYQGQPIDFGRPFARYTLAEAITAYLPRATPALLADLDAARALALELGLVVKDDDGLAQVQLELFEKVVEEQLIQPTFVTDFPVEVSPLARRRADNPALTERFELFIAGRELANGFSELNDPEDQAARFLEQAARKAAGDEEAMYFDADYVEALEYGLPPTAGEGIGVDRLAMLFADVTSIREVILFPHLRPER